MNANKFDQSLSEIIADYNHRRVKTDYHRDHGLKQLRLSFLPFVTALVVFVSLAYIMSYSTLALASGIIGLVGLTIIYVWKFKNVDAPAEELRNNFRKNLIPKIFPGFEEIKFFEKFNGLIYKMPDSILPTYDSGEWGDMIKGQFGERKFTINEMHLTSTDSDSNTTTDFKGIAVQFNTDSKAPSTLIVRNNRMALTQWLTNATGLGVKEPRIGFPDRSFEERIDVHCQDEDYARRIFTAKGVDYFKHIQDSYASRQFQFVAEAHTVSMLIEHDRNFFEIPPIDQPFDEIEDVAKLRGEINGFMTLLDNIERLLQGVK